MNEPHISNIEWGLVIGALLAIDLVQFVLDILVVGAIVNTFIDIGVGLCFGFYLRLRGLKFGRKRLLGFLGTFVAELIPVVNALPLWFADGIYNFALYKSDKLLAVVPGGDTVNAALDK